MITHTESISFYKATGENVELHLQHLDQHMDQLDKAGDQYYIPDDAIHLVKLDDDEVLLLDSTVMNRKLLTTFIFSKTTVIHFALV
jgi:hypothetical protein